MLQFCRIFRHFEARLSSFFFHLRLHFGGYVCSIIGTSCAPSSPPISSTQMEGCVLGPRKLLLQPLPSEPIFAWESGVASLLLPHLGARTTRELSLRLPPPSSPLATLATTRLSNNGHKIESSTQPNGRRRPSPSFCRAKRTLFLLLPPFEAMQRSRPPPPPLQKQVSPLPDVTSERSHWLQRRNDA